MYRKLNFYFFASTVIFVVTFSFENNQEFCSSSENDDYLKWTLNLPILAAKDKSGNVF